MYQSCFLQYDVSELAEERNREEARGVQLSAREWLNRRPDFILHDI